MAHRLWSSGHAKATRKFTEIHRQEQSSKKLEHFRDLVQLGIGELYQPRVSKEELFILQTD